MSLRELAERGARLCWGRTVTLVFVESVGDFTSAVLGAGLLAAVESKEAERLALADDVVVAVDRAAGVCWNVDARNLDGLDLSAGDCSGETGETALRVVELLLLFWCLCAVGGVKSCAVFGCVSAC